MYIKLSFQQQGTLQNPQKIESMKIKKPYYGSAISINSINSKHISTVSTGLASLADPWLASEL